MENKEKSIDKAAELLTKELEGLNDEGLHEFFMFFYRLNHQYNNMIDHDKFEEFLSSFEDNPFKVRAGKNFRKQLIDNMIKYAYDHMSLITAAVLIKKKFTLEEIVANYYSNINSFENNMF